MDGTALLGTTSLAFLAGTLSVLSPCVLPILPLVVGGAISAHRWGALALAAGLTLSFTAIGLFVATIGFSIGLSSGTFQFASAGLLIAFGIVLLLPQLQTRFAAALGPLVNGLEQRAARFPASGFGGQFALGLLFGAAWTPCTGPTLGAAAMMASAGHNMVQAAAGMLAFGIGASLPLLSLGLISRSTFQRWRGRLAGSGRHGRILLGIVLVLFGLLIVTGLDQTLETVLVAHFPTWLSDLTTRY